mmetsp:Transcript_7353/g.5619  ORF Transcript_7353/g.5619 Transcript_7353/m.5619 type:complete len:115 (-) Transcript_7353:230-574(-)
MVKILSDFQAMFFPSDWIEYYPRLLPMETEIVLTHNDGQENNMLVSLRDNLSVMLIDYEYSGWQPRAMDLADYFNEVMTDNAFPYPPGIAYYLENIMQESDLEYMVTAYLQHYR